jgi:methylmalonyl-CoA mutase, N-terminal domain
MAGILNGLRSMHTDAYDEAGATPTEETERIAVAIQNISREEAGLCDVIDPLAGSYYLETLTDQMEAEILSAIAKIDAVGGMYRAVESGLVPTMIGESALRYQQKIERGEASYPLHRLARPPRRAHREYSPPRGPDGRLGA